MLPVKGHKTSPSEVHSYLGLSWTRWTEECRHVFFPHLVDESSQGNFGITVCVHVHKVQTVVSQEGGIWIHLLHGYLHGRAQPQGAEGERNVPRNLEADEQPASLSPICVVVYDCGCSKHQCEVEHECVAHARVTHHPWHPSHLTGCLMPEGLNTQHPGWCWEGVQGGDNVNMWRRVGGPSVSNLFYNLILDKGASSLVLQFLSSLKGLYLRL